MNIQESGEMYLETIYILSKTSKEVRAIDIGEYMGFSKPSVSRALNILKNKEIIKKDKDGFITLSKDGDALAKKIYERHTVLTKLLMNIGIDEKTATDDACRVEHYISDKTFNAIKKYVTKCSK